MTFSRCVYLVGRQPFLVNAANLTAIDRCVLILPPTRVNYEQETGHEHLAFCQLLLFVHLR